MRAVVTGCDINVEFNLRQKLTNMRILKITFLLVFLSKIALAQGDSIVITGEFTPKDMSAAYIAVVGNLGQKNFLGESKVDNGIFTIHLPANTPQGIYKLAFSMQEKVYFYWIHEGEKKYHLIFKNENSRWSVESQTGNSHRYLSDYWVKEEALLAPIRVLYFFTAQYTEKSSKLYKDALKSLNKKKDEWEIFHKNAVLKAPQYAKEVLSETKLYLYDPTWDNQEIENDFDATFWKNTPFNDSGYYQKPFFTDKLQQFFTIYIEDKIMSESEKYDRIKKRLRLTLDKLTPYENRTSYYNLMVRFFANSQYLYLVDDIDAEIQAEKMLTEEDKTFFAFRNDHRKLLQSEAPEILDSEQKNFLNSASATQKIVVFVANNTPFSQQWLAQLKEYAEKQQDTKVYAVMFTDDAQSESVQHFKGLFPTWLHHAVVAKDIQVMAEKYKLSYVPVALLLDKNNKITRIIEPFSLR